MRRFGVRRARSCLDNVTVVEDPGLAEATPWSVMTFSLLASRRRTGSRSRGSTRELRTVACTVVCESWSAKWVPAVKRGIESWQAAFESAGFKNAIIAKDAPADDAAWSAEDARYSVVHWVPTPNDWPIISSLPNRR